MLVGSKSKMAAPTTPGSALPTLGSPIQIQVGDEIINIQLQSSDVSSTCTDACNVSGDVETFAEFSKNITSTMQSPGLSAERSNERHSEARADLSEPLWELDYINNDQPQTNSPRSEENFHLSLLELSESSDKENGQVPGTVKESILDKTTQFHNVSGQDKSAEKQKDEALTHQDTDPGSPATTTSERTETADEQMYYSHGQESGIREEPVESPSQIDDERPENDGEEQQSDSGQGLAHAVEQQQSDSGQGLAHDVEQQQSDSGQGLAHDEGQANWKQNTEMEIRTTPQKDGLSQLSLAYGNDTISDERPEVIRTEKSTPGYGTEDRPMDLSTQSHVNVSGKLVQPGSKDYVYAQISEAIPSENSSANLEDSWQDHVYDEDFFEKKSGSSPKKKSGFVKPKSITVGSSVIAKTTYVPPPAVEVVQFQSPDIYGWNPAEVMASLMVESYNTMIRNQLTPAKPKRRQRKKTAVSAPKTSRLRRRKRATKKEVTDSLVLTQEEMAIIDEDNLQLAMSESLRAYIDNDVDFLDPTDIQGCYHDQMDILHQIVINNDYDEAIIQTKLLSLQRREFDVTADGNCMFRAIADQLLFHPTQPIQCNYQDIRNAAVAYLRRNKSWLELQISGYTADYRLSYDDYCTFMSMDKKWGDHVILYVLSLILPIPIKVVSCGVTWTANEHLDESEVFPMQYDIVLVYKNKNHYMSSRKLIWDQVEQNKVRSERGQRKNEPSILTVDIDQVKNNVIAEALRKFNLPQTPQQASTSQNNQTVHNKPSAALGVNPDTDNRDRDSEALIASNSETQTGEQSQSNRPDAEGDVTLTIDKSTTNADVQTMETSQDSVTFSQAMDLLTSPAAKVLSPTKEPRQSSPDVKKKPDADKDNDSDSDEDKRSGNEAVAVGSESDVENRMADVSSSVMSTDNNTSVEHVAETSMNDSGASNEDAPGDSDSSSGPRNTVLTSTLTNVNVMEETSVREPNSTVVSDSGLEMSASLDDNTYDDYDFVNMNISKEDAENFFAALKEPREKKDSPPKAKKQVAKKRCTNLRRSPRFLPPNSQMEKSDQDQKAKPVSAARRVAKKILTKVRRSPRFLTGKMELRPRIVVKPRKKITKIKRPMKLKLPSPLTSPEAPISPLLPEVKKEYALRNRGQRDSDQLPKAKPTKDTDPKEKSKKQKEKKSDTDPKEKSKKQKEKKSDTDPKQKTKKQKEKKSDNKSGGKKGSKPGKGQPNVKNPEISKPTKKRGNDNVSGSIGEPTTSEGSSEEQVIGEISIPMRMRITRPKGKKVKIDRPRGTEPRLLPKGSTKCPNCKKGFSDAAQLQAHIKTVHTKKKWQCDECGAEFVKKFSLKNHIDYVHLGKKHKCTKCAKEFRRLDELRLHMFRHENQYRFMCDMCGKGFNYKNEMIGHKNNHLQLRPYKCGKPGCDKSYAYPGQLARHVSLCGVEADIPCPREDCDQMFACDEYLRNHLKTYHQEGEPFVCATCNFSTYYYPTFKKHLESHLISQ